MNVFEKKKEEVKDILNQKLNEVGIKSQTITTTILVGGSLICGYIAGALSSAILFKIIKGDI